MLQNALKGYLMSFHDGTIINKKTNITIKNNCELLLAVTIFFSYIISVFNHTIRFLLGNIFKIDTLLVYGLYAILCLLCIKEILHRIKIQHILFLLIVLFFLLAATIVSGNQKLNILVIQDVLIKCVPVFLLAASAHDFSNLKKYITTASIITPYCIAFIIFVLRVDSILLNESSYSQNMSYFALLPTIVLLNSMFEEFNLKKLAPFLISFFIMLSYGARGPITCLMFFMFAKIIISVQTSNNKKRIAMLVFFGILGSLLNYYLSTVLQWMMSVLRELGFSVRSVELLVNKSFFEDTARTELIELSINRIIRNPLLGTGMINERLYLSKIVASGENIIGYYPHNILLEILLQFGLVFGLIIIIFLLIKLFMCFGSRIHEDTRSVVLIFVGIGLFPLFFSGSYISDPNFYILCSVCISVQINK